MPKPLLAAFAVFLLAIGLVLGFGLGSSKAAPRWQQTPAHASAETKVASFQGSSWTYGVRGSVAWIGEDGTFHEDGWPPCLNERTTSAHILITPRTVDVDGTGIRPVLAVDCR
ncbi:hypothetical protein [Nocardioides cavernaquae]|uniref:Uncharacterized protein n=1 Tax=Nocardioides cavernaquae TaxID=2321396 RepID=A0A3A5H437_9ACTN|nr:hypothetical protein [Nocardioides cavernaquae]RJS45506.1 hypothetical protein D4739_04240 [Nocardioides cavernaquae]